MVVQPTPSIRLGIAGFGRVAASRYVPALRACGAFDVRFVVDRDFEARSRALRAFPNAEVRSDAEETCRVSPVDAWLIAVPPHDHYALTLAALEGGRHVYVEKPMTLRSDDAARLAGAARATDRVAIVGYVERFAPAYVALKRRLAELPSPRGVRIETRLTFDEPSPPPWKTPETGGGALSDIAVHHADLVCFLFESEIVEVLARLRSERLRGDTAEIEMRLANGARATGFFSSAHPLCDSITVRHAGGALRAHRTRHVPALFRRLCGIVERFRKIRAPATDPAFLACFSEFARAIREKRAMQPDLDDGERGVRFMEAAQRSAERGGWVAV
jgi:predicted dehydrogenase